jgi:RecJ-like exonuclease
MTLTTSNVSETTEIECCPVCEGRGIISKDKLVSYHNSDYDYWNELCPECGGEGRVVEYSLKSRIIVKNEGYPEKSTYVITRRQEQLNGRKTTDIYKVKE